jgi:hypothetical protein
MAFLVPIVCAISDQEFYSFCTAKRTSGRDQKLHKLILEDREDQNIELLSCKVERGEHF